MPSAEIAEDAGEDQSFLFGHLAEQVDEVRYTNTYQPTPLEQRSPELAQTFKAIEAGIFGDGAIYAPLLKTVYEHDYYLVCYVPCPKCWTKANSVVRYPTTLVLTSLLKSSWMNAMTLTRRNGRASRSSPRSTWVISAVIGQSRTTPMVSGVWNLAKYQKTSQSRSIWVDRILTAAVMPYVS